MATVWLRWIEWLSGYSFNELRINFAQATSKHSARHPQTFTKSKSGAALITLMDAERDKDDI